MKTIRGKKRVKRVRREGERIAQGKKIDLEYDQQEKNGKNENDRQG